MSRDSRGFRALWIVALILGMNAFACVRVQPTVHLLGRTADHRNAVATRAILDSHRLLTTPPGAHVHAPAAIAVERLPGLTPPPRIAGMAPPLRMPPSPATAMLPPGALRGPPLRPVA